MASTDGRTQQLRPNIAKSPYFTATEKAGAIRYEPYNRTYWPVDYGRDPKKEYRAINDRAVLIDVGCERIVELRGPDALAFADYLCTRNLRTIKRHRARHTAVCEPDGTILCEAIVVRVADDIVWIGHGPVDFPEWVRVIDAYSDFDVQIDRSDVFPLAVQGPRAYEIMRNLAPEAADMRFFQWIRTAVAGVESIVIRSGYTGEFGYEVYPFDPELAPRLWDSVVEAGKPHGLMISPMVGPNFERAVTDFRHGDDIGLNPFEARLERSVDLDAGPFIGKEALQRVVQEGARRKMLGVRFDSDTALPVLEQRWRIEPLQAGDPSPGQVIRAKHSWYLNEPLGYAVVESRLPSGSRVAVQLPDHTLVGAELVDLPFIP